MSLGLFVVRLHWEFTISLTHPSAQLSFSIYFLHLSLPWTAWRNHLFLLLHFNDKVLTRSTTDSHQCRIHTKHASLFTGKITFQREGCAAMWTNQQLTEAVMMPGLTAGVFLSWAQAATVPWTGHLVLRADLHLVHWLQTCISFQSTNNTSLQKQYISWSATKKTNQTKKTTTDQGSSLSLKYHVQRTFDQYYL